jgi:hypothetical protein
LRLATALGNLAYGLRGGLWFRLGGGKLSLVHANQEIGVGIADLKDGASLDWLP